MSKAIVKIKYDSNIQIQFDKGKMPIHVLEKLRELSQTEQTGFACNPSNTEIVFYTNLGDKEDVKNLKNSIISLLKSFEYLIYNL